MEQSKGGVPIKVILIEGLVALTVFSVAVTRHRTTTRLILLAQLLLGISLVLFPNLAQAAAERVGVGRGTDLLLYLLALGVYFGAIVVAARLRRQQREITAAIREAALLRERMERLQAQLDGKQAPPSDKGGQADGA